MIDNTNPFWVVLLYDEQGFFHAVKASDKDRVCKIVNSCKKVIIACSLPFEGAWANGQYCLIPDVSAPEDWKEFLSVLEKPDEE